MVLEGIIILGYISIQMFNISICIIMKIDGCYHEEPLMMGNVTESEVKQ